MKAIGKLFKLLVKTISWVIFLAFAIPVAYFAVRMGQPMDLPEYKGLTYYQYLEWEQYEQREHWDGVNPADYFVNGAGTTEEKCNAVQKTLNGFVFIAAPTNLYAYARDAGQNIDFIHFLPDWWGEFETNLPSAVTPASYRNTKGSCYHARIIPADYALSVGAQLPEMVQE